MNKEKVFIEGHEVGFLVDTTGVREKKIQVASGEIVSIDERFIYKSIEREKVAIPQFAADFIAEQKKLGHTLSYSIDASMSDRVAEWYWDNSELFALVWIFGYEVEEEKHYKIEVKGVSENSVLIHDKTEECWFFEDDNNEDTIYVYHTRKELKEAGFGWVFNCEGIEIEEVEG